MKFPTAAARVLSTVFSPMMMATYGVALAFWLSFLTFLPLSAKLTVIIVTFLATVVIPVIAIYLLAKLKVIADPMLNNREDRTWPYVIEILCFIGVAVYLYRVTAPAWLTLFMLGGAMALITLTIVNRWWKISGHATGMGGLCAMLFYLMVSGNSVYTLQWQFLTAILLAGLVCASRLVLNRHTLGQVAAGFLNGFAWIFLSAYLILH